MNNKLDAYRKTSIHTASKEQILLMLYQAAIKNCRKAIEAINRKEIAKKGEYIGKLQDIVVELNNSLDFDIGGKVAEELASLYDYILFTSTQANIKIESVPLEGCLKVLNTLYEGWSVAIKSLQGETPKTNTTEGKND
jgi:flagellar secretion chaperone FliS